MHCQTGKIEVESSYIFTQSRNNRIVPSIAGKILMKELAHGWRGRSGSWHIRVFLVTFSSD
jgi:hypothetical protein